MAGAVWTTAKLPAIERRKEIAAMIDRSPPSSRKERMPDRPVLVTVAVSATSGGTP
jgi:hypothetical protein